MNAKIRRLSHAMGAEVSGIDLSRPLDDETFDQIHKAFLDYGILLFRGRALTRQQHIAFSRRFGELDRQEGVVLNRTEDPEIFLNKPELGAKAPDYVGEYWHTDNAFSLKPSMASLLRAVEIPRTGGDTMFANMYLAYETLSDGMKKLIAGLHGVHYGGTRRLDTSTPERLAETMRLNPPVAHPIVKVHPETGRKVLYLTEKIKQFAGMSADESKPLLRFLCSHATRAQFVYRHCWLQDDLVMWDNRCMMHNAVGDYDRSRIRHMERTTLLGTQSGSVYDGPLQ
ncbi:MAG: TauD/TfdA family dioxygenase [Betaproteobacteria bacterium]|nr:TauD/TfdA family dioxygenase [Betaproteobacteria bacterium]